MAQEERCAVGDWPLIGQSPDNARGPTSDLPRKETTDDRRSLFIPSMWLGRAPLKNHRKGAENAEIPQRALFIPSMWLGARHG
ncbi:MAG: hypothetical protein D6723_14050 [Acidobacteria bacterium]|nr:MAG: hypothetical protein D6723_14050 [Acidobacteriota bacterium]